MKEENHKKKGSDITGEWCPSWPKKPYREVGDSRRASQEKDQRDPALEPGR